MQSQDPHSVFGNIIDDLIITKRLVYNIDIRYGLVNPVIYSRSRKVIPSGPDKIIIRKRLITISARIRIMLPQDDKEANRVSRWSL